MWWQEAVIYQIYPRSFQDSDGDGVGDLGGIEQRLDHLAWLGVDALWLSPIYPSPLADFGYDISDYTDVDPTFGDLAELEALARDAHDRGLRLLMDLVPCHTSIEHPWFLEHPDWYVWSDRDGPQNNWVATFGGSAWSPDPHGRGWYLHSFYPEQPDLDWRNPEPVAAMQDALRFWVERGVDGFRIDAIDRLMKDPDLRDDPPRTEPFGLPLRPEEEKLALTNSRNGPGTGEALKKIRDAVGPDSFLVGEVYLPSDKVGPYLDHFDRFFVFELLFSPMDPGAIAKAKKPARREGTGPAWVMSNHDFGWLASRVGPEHAEEALELLLSLPGTVFLYQGDEFGMENGPDTGGDRYGRDAYRTPLDWSRRTPLLEKTRQLIAERHKLMC